jgi:hypothetical protein
VTRATAAAVAAAALACGAAPGEPGPHVRILSAAPAGAGVAVGAAAEVRFTAAVDGDGLLDGRWAALVEAASLRAAVAAAEGEGATTLAVAARAALADGATRLVLVPAAPLRPWTPHALVVSSRARAADGRPVLDPEGRRRTFVATFETGAPDGPQPLPAITEARVRAEAPQAGGEYVEVANLGQGALDLAGWRLSRRSASGATSSCAVGAGVVPAGGVSVVAGGAWDGRYALPAGAPVLTCGTAAVVGGLADDRAPALSLSDPLGAVRATLGAAGAPVCEVAVERIRAEGPDLPANLRCGSGSPGR